MLNRRLDAIIADRTVALARLAVLGQARLTLLGPDVEQDERQAQAIRIDAERAQVQADVQDTWRRLREEAEALGLSGLEPDEALAQMRAIGHAQDRAAIERVHQGGATLAEALAPRG